MLRLRIHLGSYFLQQLFNLTDRQIEYAIKDNAAYQLFCGKCIVKKWHYLLAYSKFQELIYYL